MVAQCSDYWVAWILFTKTISWLISACDCLCRKGTHLITGAIMLNGVACGMIYRPLKAITRKPDIGTAAASVDDQYSTGRPSAVLEKQYVPVASLSSLSPGRTIIMNDVRVAVTDSISRSMHEVTEVSSHRKCLVTWGVIAWLVYYSNCLFQHWIPLFITRVFSLLINVVGLCLATILCNGF